MVCRYVFKYKISKRRSFCFSVIILYKLRCFKALSNSVYALNVVMHIPKVLRENTSTQKQVHAMPKYSNLWNFSTITTQVERKLKLLNYSVWKHSFSSE